MWDVQKHSKEFKAISKLLKIRYVRLTNTDGWLSSGTITDVKHVLINPYSFLSFPRPQSEEWEVAAPWRQSQSRQSAHREPHRPPHRAAETRDSRMLSNIKTQLDGRRQDFWCWFFCCIHWSGNAKKAPFFWSLSLPVVVCLHFGDHVNSWSKFWAP